MKTTASGRNINVPTSDLTGSKPGKHKRTKSGDSAVLRLSARSGAKTGTKAGEAVLPADIQAELPRVTKAPAYAVPGVPARTGLMPNKSRRDKEESAEKPKKASGRKKAVADDVMPGRVKRSKDPARRSMPTIAADWKEVERNASTPHRFNDVGAGASGAVQSRSGSSATTTTTTTSQSITAVPPATPSDTALSSALPPVGPGSSGGKANSGVLHVPRRVAAPMRRPPTNAHALVMASGSTVVPAPQSGPANHAGNFKGELAAALNARPLSPRAQPRSPLPRAMPNVDSTSPIQAPTPETRSNDVTPAIRRTLQKSPTERATMAPPDLSIHSPAGLSSHAASRTPASPRRGAVPTPSTSPRPSNETGTNVTPARVFAAAVAPTDATPAYWLANAQLTLLSSAGYTSEQACAPILKLLVQLPEKLDDVTEPILKRAIKELLSTREKLILIEVGTKCMNTPIFGEGELAFKLQKLTIAAAHIVCLQLGELLKG